MTTNELIVNLRKLKNELHEQFGIEEIALFGSYARGEATEESDVDIAILQMNLKSGFDVIRARDYLKDELGKEVDMGTFKSMKTFIKNRIKKDFIYV